MKVASKQNTADDEAEIRPEKKGPGGVVKFAVLGTMFLGLGAGGAYGAYASGLFGGESDDIDDTPALIRKGESDPYMMPGADDDIAIVHGASGSDYRTAYYNFAESFTSNLAGSPALIQVDLAVSTRRDGRVLMWVQTHELALRSAVLAVLAETSEAEVFDADGRDDLAVRLASAINAVLEEEEGFGGIDAVHFKGLLVQ